LERRTILFLGLSLAIVIGSQALRQALFPDPVERPAEGVAGVGADADTAGAPDPGDGAAAARREAGEPAAGEPSADGVSGRVADTAGSREGDAAKDTAPVEPTEAPGDALLPLLRRSLGSLDRAAGSGMLVTLTSRGAAVERIELAGERFHDQDDRTAYVGHLYPEAAPGGCRLGFVGPGTPAAAAGLRAGDVVTAIGGEPTPDPVRFREVLAAHRPGRSVAIAFLREGEAADADVVAGFRPLEVVRPERLTQPVEDGHDGTCDPLSFLVSLEEVTVGGRTLRRPELSSASTPAARGRGQIAGHDLWNASWRLVGPQDGGGPDREGVRFERDLPGGLVVSKTYRLRSADGQGPADDRPQPAQPRLEVTVTFRSREQACSLSYAIDGPTGLPTEGWWYASRISRTWGGLGVRDPAVRFVREPSNVISSLSLLSDSLDHPASAVRDDKPLAFAGVDALYFASALVPAGEGAEAPSLAEVRPLVVGEAPDPARRKLVNTTARLVSRPLELAAGGEVSHRYEIFAGPKRPDLLAAYGPEGSAMDDLVTFGWFGWVARPMIALLHALYAVVGNYGVAIVLLTVLVRGAMFPVSRKQALASQKMQALQPEMKAIADRYKNEPEKRTKATQELWRKHDYNPMGGCLLVFIQVPIFIGLYRSLATDVELRQAPLFSSWIRWCSNLAAPDMLLDWSGWLPAFLVAPEGWLGPFLNLFPLATIGLFLWQQHLFMPPPVDEQARVQQQVMKYMMFFMALMFFKVPCGLCLYFIASSLWGIVERIWLPVPQPVASPGGPVPTEPSRGARIIDAIASRVPFADELGSPREATAGQRRKGRSRRRRS
jgi:YidC/Oxa1 family membrane protein insertase